MKPIMCLAFLIGFPSWCFLAPPNHVIAADIKIMTTCPVTFLPRHLPAYLGVVYQSLP